MPYEVTDTKPLEFRGITFQVRKTYGADTAYAETMGALAAGMKGAEADPMKQAEVGAGAKAALRKFVLECIVSAEGMTRNGEPLPWGDEALGLMAADDVTELAQLLQGGDAPNSPDAPA
jgi:hypothetical protein